MFENIELAPADPILGLNEAFKKDTNPNKINLGVGVYKDEEGNTPVLNSVKAAEQIIIDEEKTKSYLPIDGSPEYKKHIQKLIFGEKHEIISSERAATVQSPGGTGALRIAADFIKKFFPDSKIWLSNPTWANHGKIFNAAGLETDTYTYYDSKTNLIDFEGLCDNLSNMTKKDVVVFHACCHNPTGMDLTHDQWKKVASIAHKKNFVPIFDFAYQGFGKGLDEDAQSIRFFADKIKTFFVANSFSKNFGLYNERIGGLTAVTHNNEEAKKVLSQLKICVRSNYSNPPSHGASIVTTILSTQDLRTVWEGELAEMRNRINSFRDMFIENLKTHGCKQSFSFMKQQQGMFSYTGLSKELVRKLRSDYSIYFVDSGRINIAGINNENIDTICKAFAKVLKN